MSGRRVLAGRYRLDEVIGRGGMSTVYRATDLALDRVVAVKVALDPVAEENPTYVARFKREARAAAAINHPGVVTVYDAGADGPTRYIVMEHVEGKSLSDLLRVERPLDPDRAAGIAEQVADTLAVAHAAGIVHRDIKPGNIMVGPGDRVKVLDFGIARVRDGVTLTQTASVLGTAPYMAPEQAMGNPADARSDIYSLGCVLYEMLTGQPPFMADVPAAVLHQHVRVPVKPPRERNPDVPPALDALDVQMLAKNPEDRPQTAAEVRDRLAGFLTGDPTVPTTPIAPVEVLAAAAAVPQAATVPQPATPAPEPTAPTTALPPPTRAPAPAPRRRGAGPWVALAAIAVVLLGAAVAYALAGGGTSHSASTPSHPAATGSGSSHVTTSQSPATTNGSTSASTTTTTVTTTATSTPTTSSTSSTSTPTTTVTTPPGQGGTPPGHAKKGKPK